MDPQPAPSDTVGVIYTGGTFGMVRSDRGYVPSADLPERVQSAVGGVGRGDLPRVEWLGHDWPLINSSDVTPRFWFDLAAAIAARAGDYAGFVVIHGTDTLAYTGSALSFLLAGLDCPVVVTGAKAPLGEPGSDAPENLRSALRVAASDIPAEVTVAFGGRLLRANRATKRHGGGDNPFDSPCMGALAELGDTVRPLEYEPLPAQDNAPTLPCAAWADTRVALLPVYPGVSGGDLRAVRDTGIGALILEAYPAGVGPGGDADFVAAVAETVRAGVVVAAISQARQGTIRLGRYATSTPLAEAGLVGGADITREAALTKLHYLLSLGLAPPAIAESVGRNLCGELTSSGAS